MHAVHLFLLFLFPLPDHSCMKDFSRYRSLFNIYLKNIEGSGFHLEIFVWGGTGEVDSIVSLYNTFVALAIL